MCLISIVVMKILKTIKPCYYKTTIHYKLDHHSYYNKVATLIFFMIAKLRTNSHKLHKVTRDGVLKTSWEIIYET